MKAVLFDFSGTLFRIESVATWLRATLDEAGVTLAPEEFELRVAELAESGALPGGPAPRRVPPSLAGLWASRDESAAGHRAAFTGLARQVELPDPALHEALYARHMTPDAWTPYPDTTEVLSTLHGRGIRVAVVSNIGWDLRPVFRAHGADPYVDEYILSYEYGVQKPDVRLFGAACEALGQDPRETLMVGDDRRTDAGAANLGCAVHFVDHLPAAERPDALRPVLGLTG
ncbi:HAD family hydrolase [Streptomyces sp. NBC_00859]|uniref:HAD family hydrolase n=1 Tax=Streptomyces sp. NBC_00859 TaxID=2903682 RepID=UPI003868DB14|nr:HAD-IA family hydrolase [Streptomyces sp. NBC_00859]